MVLTYVDQQGENGTIAWGLNYYVRRICPPNSDSAR